ncbi:MAG: hypothetical protein FWE67_13420, partial [Planctomycetaceae bacterium]|nr:hypothetical protein [Planctomycetaceae bacterium]
MEKVNLFFRSRCFRVCAAVLIPLFLSVLNIEETRGQTDKKNSLPVYTFIEPTEYRSLLDTVPFEEAAKSTLFPNTLANRIRKLSENNSENDAENNRDAANSAALSVLSRWAADTLQTLTAMTWFAEKGQYRSCIICQKKLEDAVAELANIRRIMLQQNNLQNSPQKIMLEEIQLGLEERCLLWKYALWAALEPALPISRLFDKNADDLHRLAKKTLDAENYFLKDNAAAGNNKKSGELWCEYLDTKAFRTDLEAVQRSLQSPIIRVSSSPSVIPISLLVSFSGRANTVLNRLNSKELTKDQ